MGVDVDLDAVPLREEGLEPFEILTSESQERMLCIVHPSKLADVTSVCEKWGLRAPAIGTVVPGGNLKVTSRGEVVADVPARSLADEGPVYERPMAAPPSAAALNAPDPAKADIDPRDAFLHVLSSPNIASKRWVFEQYDSIVQHGTVKGPGPSDAAIIRIDETRKAIALSSDGAGRYGSLDPYLGAAHAVAEAARNVAVTGATPLAITNCMNFGNPERPEVMWQFAESIRGLRDACLAFDTPVTGGNVSFYNESGSSAIWPTPIVGMLGLIHDYRRAVPAAFPAEAGRAIYLLGETTPEFGGSEFAETVLGRIDGTPPSLDLEREAALHRLLVEAADGELLASAHDCSDGGLAVALAESAMAGGIGFHVRLDNGAALAELFSESASRAIVSAGPADDAESRLEAACERHRVPFRKIGATGGDSMSFDELFTVPLAEARDGYERAIPRLLAG
jgi:phosphoribosylformylglycinamidine synthase